MNLLRMTTFSLAVCVSLSAAQAGWMNFTVGSPAAGTGTWPGGSAYTGSATVTASNFINGISWTPLVGLTPNNIGNLSPDFYGAGLVPNAGNVVPFITTPYNDSGDKYHVDIDFAGTSFGSLTGVLPAGTLIALGNLDINENYRNISATNAANVPITTSWLAGPNGYFDMTTPMLPQSSIIPNPVINVTGPGTYDMLGVSYNFDVGMWLFQTTQNIRVLSFDMERGIPSLVLGGGGAGWAFYSPAIPEPSSAVLAAAALLCGFASRRQRVEAPMS